MIRVVATFRAYGQPQRDEALYARVAACSTHAYVGPEREAGEEDRQPELPVQPVQRGSYIFNFSTTGIVHALAPPSAAKVEAQHRESKALKGLHGVVDDLIVHGSAAHRVRMTDKDGVFRIVAARVEKSFETAGRSGDVKRTKARLTRGDRVSREGIGHGISILILPTGSSILRSMPLPSLPLDPVQLTRQLIDIESITYGEGNVGEFLYRFLGECGFVAERMPVSRVGEGRATTDRFNVYAGVRGEQPDVVFSTHMDTVPPFIPSSEDETWIYGRGACDAKGIIAAQIAAALRLCHGGVKAGLLFVVGEERDSAGAKVANEQPKGSRFLINGEPTDNRLALASKGTLRAAVRARGRMAHSAYPELGESAVHKLVEALHRVLQVPLPALEEVGPSTLNIGVIEGGRAPNVIADEAEAQVLVRLVGPSGETRRALEEAVAGLAEVDFTLEIPFMRMKRIEGLDTMIASFTTDVPALTNWGEPLLLGPGSIHVAHTPHERLRKQELAEAIELYTQVAGRLLP